MALIFSNDVATVLDAEVERLAPSSVFVLVDVNTSSFVLPRMQAQSRTVASARIITIKPGDDNKNVESLSYIWKQLSDLGANRASLLVNLGGGMVSDIGAFAASTFKRGIRFINVPTTLLAAVDASVGGKSGINFNSLKNEVGLFTEPQAVIISTTFFNTLTSQELLSGYAEMIKHAMITSRDFTNRILAYNINSYSPDTLLDILRESVKVKSDIVAQDFNEQGLRRVLNFGHTFGHAFESLAMDRKSPIPHGYAVAFGMLVALVLSRMQLHFPSDDLHRYASFVGERYGAFSISCDDYPRLLHFMHSDKKNYGADVSAVLLHDFGDPVAGITVKDTDITAALDIYRDLLHLP